MAGIFGSNSMKGMIFSGIQTVGSAVANVSRNSCLI